MRPATKLFALDTNVLLHDPWSLYKFEEHDLYITDKTFRELEKKNEGITEQARNSRQAARLLGELIEHYDGLISEGIPLKTTRDNYQCSGKLFLQMSNQQTTNSQISMNDDQVTLETLLHIRDLPKIFKDRDVILVSKDIYLRIKARCLGLKAEDYFSDQVKSTSDWLRRGSAAMPEIFLSNIDCKIKSWKEDSKLFYEFKKFSNQQFHSNEFLYQKDSQRSNQGYPDTLKISQIKENTVILQTIDNYMETDKAVWGIIARNKEQNYALNLLMDPAVYFISLVGVAGTGKTLLALAAGLAQTLETKQFSEIIVTRNTTPIGDDIGFLPGTEEEKMTPWMGAIEDNIEVLHNLDNSSGNWGKTATMDFLYSKISVRSLNFMRGRTFTKKFLIIDEAQNLTASQMKTLITRAGQGTKVVCLGNNSQIDSPYLTEESSGLTYVVDRFKDWSGAGHVALSNGERSELADYATENL